MAAVEAATTAKQLRVNVTGVGLVEWSTGEFCCILGTRAHWLGLGTRHSGSGVQGGGGAVCTDRVSGVLNIGQAANRSGPIDVLPRSRTQRGNKYMNHRVVTAKRFSWMRRPSLHQALPKHR